MWFIDVPEIGHSAPLEWETGAEIMKSRGCGRWRRFQGVPLDQGYGHSSKVLPACLLSRDCSSLCLPLSHSPCLYAKQTLFINYSTFLTECASALDSFSAATTNPSKGAYEMKTICHRWPNSKETHNERGRLKD